MEKNADSPAAQQATPFAIIEKPGMYYYSQDALNAVGIDDEHRIAVCFGTARILLLPADCKLYDAPHLVCWNNNNSEVCFFVRQDGHSRLCTMRRHLDTADMWNLHGIPSEILLEPSEHYPDRLFITPVVDGVHVRRSPFYYDDFEQISCLVKGLYQASEPAPQPPADYIGLAAQSQPQHTPEPQRKAVNRMTILSIAAISVAWMAAIVVLARLGNDRAAAVLGTSGGLGILFAAIGRLAIHYRSRTSPKAMRWRILAFLLLVGSTLTYQMARGLYALWRAICGPDPSIGLLLLAESLLLTSIPLIYSRRSMQLDECRHHDILAWLVMLAAALWVGCAIFAARIIKTL